MKRIFSFALIIFVFGSLFVFPQAKRKEVSQLPDAEPFKIATGSSFSASRAGTSVSSEQTSQLNITQDYQEALDVIRQNYVGGNRIDYSELTKSAITAMLRTLDPHSNYFDANEYQDLLTDQQSEYFGIGATISNYMRDGKYETFIISTFQDSPAYKANLHFGDKIIAVNGENVSGKNSAVVRDKVRGKKGTIVRLTIERADTEKHEIVEIRRNRVPQPSIPDAYLLRGNIGYVDLSEGFNYTTFDELEAALSDLHARGMTSLIMDLRDNPGGILDQAVMVAEKFLPDGDTIVTQRGRFKIDNRVWKSANRQAEAMPLVVLVNENSASASEIVAGALQDYDRALIIGENTFGKGLVQSIINLPYGSGLTLTTAKYYTPSGRSIQRDYSNGNIYDYFLHKEKIEESAKIPAKTVTGRTVYGGDGIQPDETIKDAELNQPEVALLDPLFFFTSELAAGKISGFESFKVTNQFQYGQRISSNNFPLTDELFAVFKRFVAEEKGWNVTAEQIEAEKSFIKLRLRYNLAIANYGSVAANQVLIEEDLQVARAVEALPKAKQLALAAQKSQQKQNK
ncbi:MAG TPA: S41 family peptidase [Pyrinomonadaceae bacterium]|jgi:carboxyl-terminal processing protease